MNEATANRSSSSSVNDSIAPQKRKRISPRERLTGCYLKYAQSSGDTRVPGSAGPANYQAAAAAKTRPPLRTGKSQATKKKRGSHSAPAGNLQPTTYSAKQARVEASQGQPQQKTSRSAPRRLQEFLERVNCRPEEVKDIPPGRRLTTAQLKAECARIDPQAQRRSLGEMGVYFGKHRGTKLKDVPLNYLDWVVSEPAQTRSFRRFQRQVREFLGRDA
jgi:hypothetical protein